MDVPADIRETVDAIFDNVAADESVADAVARALMAERERAAKIAESLFDDDGYPKATGHVIAAAIRA